MPFVYSVLATIKLRAPQYNTGFDSVLDAYQKAVEDNINNVLRATLGEFDKNGYRIILPLTGLFDIIDPQKMEVTLAMSDDIIEIGNEAVIALARWDFSEAKERKDMSKVDLEEELQQHYGGIISTPHDFTTEFLEADKLTWDDGLFMQLEDSSGVWLWG